MDVIQTTLNQLSHHLSSAHPYLQQADQAKDFPDQFPEERVIEILGLLTAQGEPLIAIATQCKEWDKLELNTQDQQNLAKVHEQVKELRRIHQRLLFLMEHFNPMLVHTLFVEGLSQRGVDIDIELLETDKLNS